MIEYALMFALGAVLTGAAFLMAERSARSERAQLLDRIMARDLREYVSTTGTKSLEPIPQVVTDADEARYATEHGLVTT